MHLIFHETKNYSSHLRSLSPWCDLPLLFSILPPLCFSSFLACWSCYSTQVILWIGQYCLFLSQFEELQVILGFECSHASEHVFTKVVNLIYRFPYFKTLKKHAHTQNPTTHTLHWLETVRGMDERNFLRNKGWASAWILAKHVVLLVRKKISFLPHLARFWTVPA